MEKELFKAILNAQKDGLSGIVLTNNPKTDLAILFEKNKKIFLKHGLSLIAEAWERSDGAVNAVLIVMHHPSGQSYQSENILENNKKGRELKYNSSEVYLSLRIQYEMLFSVTSSNDAVEAEVYGPKKVMGPNKVEQVTSIPPFSTSLVSARRESLLTLLGMDLPSYKDEQREYIELSWSDIKLFLRCKRCFYNAKKHNIRLSIFDVAGYGLEKITDMLLKKEFDQYRSQKKPHPVMLGSQAVWPCKHKKIDQWRTAWKPGDFNKGGVQYYDAWANWLVYGGVDDVWLNDKKELIIVDYKSSTNGRIYSHYKKQIEFYAWIFRKNNYSVSDTAYILLYKPITNKDSFEWKLEFEPRLEELIIDDSWVQKEIYNALDCLENDDLPESGIALFGSKNKKCEVCDYFDKLSSRVKS